MEIFNQDSSNFWQQIDRLEKLIRAAEVKAGILFSFHSFIIGLFINRLEFFSSFFTGNILLLIFAICWILLVLISIYFCFNCFMPKLELKYDDNVFFYKDAIDKFGNLDEFKEKITQVCTTDEDLYEQLSEQIHAECKIVDKKFLSIKKAIKFFAFSLIFVVLILAYTAILV
tara:strand:+ start:4851 stop:5366 length:516 start_codon:yes stop_codon:yes gene_type:complete